MQKSHLAAITALLTLLLPGPGIAMSKMNPLKACTFSEMELSILFKGEPAKGAKITRTIEWKKEHTDEFTADDDGRAVLPAEFETHPLKAFPMEFVSAQYVTVQYQGEEYEIWNYAKRDTELNSEMQGAPLQLTCELTSESKTQRAFGSILGTRCSWQNETQNPS